MHAARFTLLGLRPHNRPKEVPGSYAADSRQHIAQLDAQEGWQDKSQIAMAILIGPRWRLAVYSPHGHLQLLGINGARPISVKEVEGFPASVQTL